MMTSPSITADFTFRTSKAALMLGMRDDQSWPRRVKICALLRSITEMAR